MDTPDLGSELVDGDPVALDRRIAVQHASYAGPLPPASDMAAFDAVVPGLAREIVEQWKAETRHRHETVSLMRQTDHEAMLKYWSGGPEGNAPVQLDDDDSVA